MKTEKSPGEKIPAHNGTESWPLAITSAFLIVLIASFMPWGTINYHYTESFMLNLEHPGLCNRIITAGDLSGIKIGTKLNHTGSAWKSGFDLSGFFFPHWLLTVLALLLFIFAILNYLGSFFINPSIPLFLSFYGLIHVVSSAWGFFSQGSIRLGLILTGFGYLVFVVTCLRWK